MSQGLDTALLVNVGTVLCSLGAMIVAIRQADIARKSAADSQRSATAAEGQLALMREQWEAEQAEKEAADNPRLDLRVVRVGEAYDYGLALVNQGEKTLHVQRVQYSLIVTPNEQTRWHEVNFVSYPRKNPTLAPTVVPPNEQIILVGGSQYPSASPTDGEFLGPTDWSNLRATFRLGERAWELYFPFRIMPDGSIIHPNDFSIRPKRDQ